MDFKESSIRNDAGMDVRDFQACVEVGGEGKSKEGANRKKK